MFKLFALAYFAGRVVVASLRVAGELCAAICEGGAGGGAKALVRMVSRAETSRAN